MTGSIISTTIMNSVHVGYGSYGFSLTISNTGAVIATNEAAIYSNTYRTTTVTNYGFISASGTSVIEAIYGGNDMTINNFGTIDSDIGVFLRSSVLVNAGEVTGLTYGVESHSNGSLYNTGSIYGGMAGVEIYSSYTVTNRGSIGGGTIGVLLSHGEILINSGSIHGGETGLSLNNVGELANAGNISGGVAGITMNKGVILNTGSIGGGIDGIVIPSGHRAVTSATVTNAGTIAGGLNAIYSDSDQFDLTVDPGAVFIGDVVDHTGNGVINLASGVSAGSLDIGNKFYGFQQLNFAEGAQWTLEGNTSALAGAHETIGGFRPGDTLVLDGFSAQTHEFVAGVGLELGNGSVTRTLGIDSMPLYDQFAVTVNDGKTTITETGPPASLISTISTFLNAEVSPGGAYYASDLMISNTGTVAYFPGSVIFVNGETPAIEVTNAGLILTTANTYAVMVSNFSNDIITNAGTIMGGAGVFLSEGTFVNTGLVEGTAGVGLKMVQGTLVNSGEISGNLLFYDGYITNSGVLGGIVASNVLDLTIDPGAVVETGAESVADKGTLVLAGAAPGRLDIRDFSGFSQISFAAGSAWTLEGGTSELAKQQTVGGFGFGDTIVLDKFAATRGIYAAGAGLVLVDGTTTETIDLAGSFSTGDFHITTAGANTVITLEQATPCFLRGTLIRTDGGEVPVEDLAIGDRVVTLKNGAKPIKFLGRRSYRQPFAGTNANIAPILIRAGALGAGRPRRDLHVSPLHAMYLDQVLVPAGLLVNGTSICRCPEMARIDYIHIELDLHDVIFAENAATETFVDCDSRGMFHNADEYAALYPADASPAWAFCAPRVESGQALRAIQRRLAARAGLMPDVVAAPREARLEGFLDHADRRRVSGWAWLPDYPNETVELEVLDGRGVIARVPADRFRVDLADLGKGDGRHGFELHFGQNLSPARHMIHVRRAQGGAPLSQSPMIVPVIPKIMRKRATDSKPRGDCGRPIALVLDASWPVARRDAGSAAVLSHVAALQGLGFTVECFATNEAGVSPPAALAAAAIFCRSDHAALETLLRAEGGKYAVVYMHRLNVAGPYAGLVRALCPGPDGQGARKLYSVADLHHLRLGRQARAQAETALAARAKIVREEEFLAMRQVDAVITHSPAEAVYLRKIVPDLAVHVVPWDVPLAAGPLPFEDRRGIAFIGSFEHAPNLDAVRWLIGGILPRVWEKLPDLTCRLIGSGWRKAALPALDPRVTLVGLVDNLNAAVADTRLTVAPLRFGAGIKGKVLDSLAAGIACVMTPIAAEGMALDTTLRDFVTSSETEFADLICRLHEDARMNEAAGRAGQRLIEADHNPKIVAAALGQILSSAVSQNRRERFAAL